MSEGYMSPETVMRLWRPGSFEDPWTWDEERAHNEKADERQSKIDFDMRHAQRWFGPPAVLGDDGRVWDGHHRILAAVKADVQVWVSMPWMRATAYER